MGFIFVNLGKTGNFKTDGERFGKCGAYFSKINPCRWEVSSYEDKDRHNLKEDGMDYYIFGSTVDDDDGFDDVFDVMLDEDIDYPFFDDFDDDDGFDDEEE